MTDFLQQAWRARASKASNLAGATFTDAGLALGAETLLVSFGKSAIDIGFGPNDNDRLVALLAVVGRGAVASRALLQINKALADWRKGEKALAAIRLAFAKLPRVNDDEDAYRLFLAEKALDAGLAPYDLLRELGYATTLRPLLKYPGQPRDPAGIPTGGQYANGTSGQSASASVVPVFLDTRKEKDIEAKQLPLVVPPISHLDTVQTGHPLDLPIPGGLPFPLPLSGPKVAPDEREKERPSCPPEAPDRQNGPNAAAEAWEHFVHEIVNPNNPTKDGHAYYLPNPSYLLSPRKKESISFDDCKKTDEPSLILGLRKGDMVEAKNSEFNKLFARSWSNALEGMADQIDTQNRAVQSEGLGRHITYCFDGEFAASKARERYGDMYPSSRFLDCRIGSGS